MRRNPKLSGTTHNVFGIQVGVGITLAVKKKGATRRVRYHRVPEMWRKAEKLEFVAEGEIPWQALTPDSENMWLVLDHADEYRSFLDLNEMFGLRTRGLETTRDDVVYDFDRQKLTRRVERFVADYNGEVDRQKRDKNEGFPDHLKWSSRLKECLARGQYATFDKAKLRHALYRPYTKRWVFFDTVLNQRTGQWPNITGKVIVMSDIGWRAPTFNVLMTDTIADLHLCAAVDAHQCFPLSFLKDSALLQFRQHYSDDSITKEDIFHHLYALLHHPGYRERYAANLKRELPRIPLAPDFTAFATAGKELARLHVEYESLDPWPLEFIENKGVPYSERITKMKLSAEKQSVRINESLTLGAIPSETFEYRLGSRSALEWVIDQYQVKGESDPNREEDPGYIVRLVGQVVRVSVATAEIVKSLRDF